jgi:hypothetical protein
LAFFDHNPTKIRFGASAFVQHPRRFSLDGGGRIRHATIIEVAAKTVALSARPRCHLYAFRGCGARSKPRSGQISRAIVCGRLRDMSSQPTRSCQGPLSSHALPFPAKALRKQFERSLGAHFLSRVHRKSATRPITSCRGQTVASDSDTSVLDPSAPPSAATLSRRSARRKVRHPMSPFGPEPEIG